MTLYLSHLPKNNSQHPKINLRRVTSKEVVSGLLRRRRLADRREYNEGIAYQHDDVARLPFDDARNLRVGNIFDRVCAASALRDARVIILGRRLWGLYTMFSRIDLNRIAS